MLLLLLLLLLLLSLLLLLLLLNPIGDFLPYILPCLKNLWPGNPIVCRKLHSNRSSAKTASFIIRVDGRLSNIGLKRFNSILKNLNARSYRADLKEAWKSYWSPSASELDEAWWPHIEPTAYSFVVMHHRADAVPRAWHSTTYCSLFAVFLSLIKLKSLSSERYVNWQMSAVMGSGHSAPARGSQTIPQLPHCYNSVDFTQKKIWPKIHNIIGGCSQLN